MLRVILIIAVVMLTVYCVVEVAQSRKYRVRTFPKWLWAFAVIAVPVVGPIGWLTLGRPRSEPARPLPPRAPDDDEDFLRGIR
ncbi:PLD nuclease N-terminal domain-containing protein [Tessaracoccus oleiagri]|uniref:Phospholipase_D-nuclease N-terminal n=1 Tax=Tessaracoccus oleiagri TaxID=686624 RepID=A0A1G9KLX4_9ACTN|nr:PLD nuclease N-terminal domain-containing protein [Tessaracoccus oleiagri]SDL50385.1 Phospholipase_D-nuclease N-terminal [Tessaracoccus oleiagri]